VQLQDLERAIRPYFVGCQHEVSAVYLFGSAARGEATPASDIDLGILFAHCPPHTLMGQPFSMEADLSESLGTPVQIIVMNDAPPDLVHRILRDGILVVEHDKRARIAFEVKARNEYFDLLPFLRRYRGEGLEA
jgi:predicted nucleotidyltransferase